MPFSNLRYAVAHDESKIETWATNETEFLNINAGSPNREEIDTMKWSRNS